MVTSNQFQQVEELFHKAKVLDPADRASFLDKQCADALDLRAEVESLLAHSDQGTSQLHLRPSDEDDEITIVDRGRLSEGPGTRIGPYKILQQIGEGGFGVVYMAEQEEPVQRRVALKIIKLGMDTKQVIARFEAERQALAMMEHPNIAKVLEAGATETGRPYFVMELVKGITITEYCDRNKLTTRQRLDLFIQVCSAIQHAHQKGVIHRDIKPSNVLVTLHDIRPVPKVIDFGIAKATSRRLTEKTLFTEFRHFIGTPEYMSPDQAEISGLDVDTRTDVYSLGVLLYELLTGTTPFDSATLRQAAYGEIQRILREVQPPKPSTRLDTLAEEGTDIAKHRQTEPGALSKLIRGDLDWIVMRAIEKDRTRRYQSASELAADVQRYLQRQPILAGPPSVLYKFRKFVLRHQLGVVAGILIAVAMLFGLTLATIGLFQARQEAQHSREVSDFLQQMTMQFERGAGSSDDVSVDEIVQRGRELFGEDHAMFAAVLNTLALQLHDAGDFEAAVELCRESLEVWKKVHGERHPNVAITLARLGTSLRAQGDDEQAESALRAALATFDGASDTPGLASYHARVELADLLGNRGEYAEADELLGESLAILRASPSPAHFRILERLEQRFVLQISQPSVDARETIREIYDEAQEFYPDDSPMLAMTALGYGRILFQYGEHETAEPYLREAIQRFRANPKPPGIYLFSACDALFQVMRSRTDPESVAETDDLLAELIRLGRGFLGADQVADTQAYYASRMLDRGRIGDALDAFLDAHQVLVDAGRSVEERENLRDKLTALAMKVAVRPDLEPEVYALARDAVERALLEEPDHAAMIVVLGAVLYRQGEFALAAETLDRPSEPLSRSPGNLARKMAPADHAFRALAHAQLGDDEIARAEIEALHAVLDGRSAAAEIDALLREVEALLEPTPSSTGDG